MRVHSTDGARRLRILAVEDESLVLMLLKDMIADLGHVCAAACTRLDDALAWARKYAFFQYPFVTACCGMEYMSVTGPRFDTDRFGITLPRFTPRQSDLMLVVGTITHRQAPVLRRVWDTRPG